MNIFQSVSESDETNVNDLIGVLNDKSINTNNEINRKELASESNTIRSKNFGQLHSDIREDVTSNLNPQISKNNKQINNKSGSSTSKRRNSQKITDMVQNHLEFLNSKDDALQNIDDWDDDDDNGYLIIPLTEEEFFEMEEDAAKKLLIKRSSLNEDSKAINVLTTGPVKYGSQIDVDDDDDLNNEGDGHSYCVSEILLQEGEKSVYETDLDSLTSEMVPTDKQAKKALVESMLNKMDDDDEYINSDLNNDRESETKDFFDPMVKDLIAHELPTITYTTGPKGDMGAPEPEAVKMESVMDLKIEPLTMGTLETETDKIQKFIEESNDFAPLMPAKEENIVETIRLNGQTIPQTSEEVVPSVGVVTDVKSPEEEKVLPSCDPIIVDLSTAGVVETVKSIERVISSNTTKESFEPVLDGILAVDLTDKDKEPEKVLPDLVLIKESIDAPKQSISTNRRSEIMGQHQFTGVDGKHCFFNLKVIFEPYKTGFEESKDLQHPKGTIIAGRYEVSDMLGSAAFSTALQCIDLGAGDDEPQWVCLKVIKNNKDFFDQSLDEIKLLQYINSHGDADEHHVLRLIDFFYCREHLFIVSELLKENLYEFGRFIKESGNEPYYTMPRLKRIMKQVLSALEFIHSLNLIHCDIKPENIVIKSFSRCEVKLIDFGSSCFTSDHLTTYIQSRSYRAPEVILGHHYDSRIDIWSVGAVLAELHTGYVLFQNDSLPTMMSRITGILGQFPAEVLRRGKDTNKYFSLNNIVYDRDEEGRFLLIIPKRTNLRSRLHIPSTPAAVSNTQEDQFVDFVEKLLDLDPNRRLNAAQALKHPWLSDADTVYVSEYIICPPAVPAYEAEEEEGEGEEEEEAQDTIDMIDEVEYESKSNAFLYSKSYDPYSGRLFDHHNNGTDMVDSESNYLADDFEKNHHHLHNSEEEFFEQALLQRILEGRSGNDYIDVIDEEIYDEEAEDQDDDDEDNYEDIEEGDEEEDDPEYD